MSPDSTTKLLPENLPTESGNVSTQQSLTISQETPASELIASKIARRDDQEGYDTNLEGPPLQILSRDPEFEIISQEKSENRQMKVKQCISYHENLESRKNSAMKSKDTSKAETYYDFGRSRFVSFVPATKLNQIVSQRPDSLRNLNGSDLFSAVPARKVVDNISSIPQTSHDSSLVSVNKSMGNHSSTTSDSHVSEEYEKQRSNADLSSRLGSDSLKLNPCLKSSESTPSNESKSNSSLYETPSGASKISNFLMKPAKSIIDSTFPNQWKLRFPLLY